jgi:hypothetical protein
MMIKTRDANTKLYLFFNKKKRHKDTHTHKHGQTHPHILKQENIYI